MKLRFLCWMVFLFVLGSRHVGAQSLQSFVDRSWIVEKSPVTFFIQYPAQLEQIYAKNNYRRLWYDLNSGLALEHQLELIKYAGISPLFDRQLRYLTLYRERKSWYEYDLLATDTLLMFLSYAEQAPQEGMTWFFKLKLNHRLSAPSKEAMFNLEMAFELHTIIDLINEYAPRDKSYFQLVKAYDFLGKIAHESLPIYKPNVTVTPGNMLPDRRTLITRLALVNIDITRINPEGDYYDDSLVTAVQRFQRMHGMKADGVIGATTLRWLNMTIADRRRLLALNAERMRLWPRQEQASIVVNVPEYKMTYWFEGDRVFQSPVIVGRRSRPTPLITTRLDSLVFNPVWNVPHRIMVEDILPLAIEKPDYLKRHNIEVVKQWRDTEVIAPETIDWQAMNPYRFPYKMRQSAGENNALGLYKFNTPNRRAIYLHDTPHKELFDNTVRAYSSGCVRVQDARGFAQLLMKTPGLTTEPTGEDEASSNFSVALKQRIPVRMIYQTVWYEQGELHYRADIYRYDRLKRKGR